MLALDDHVALELVERGERLTPLDRAVLLAATLDNVSPKLAADLPVDIRDRLFIDARIANFGADISFFARCPNCGEGNEADFDLKALPGAVEAGMAAACVAGNEIMLRAPTSAEIAAALLRGDQAGLTVAIAGTAARPEDSHWVSELEDALAETFPLLDIRFDLACGACGDVVSTRFDIASWLWREIEGVATRAIDAVDRLARAYGWTEREILALSPRRRARYLERLAS